MTRCEARAEARRLDAAERDAYRSWLADHGAELGEALRVVSAGELGSWQVYEASLPALMLKVRQAGGGRLVVATALHEGGWDVGGHTTRDLVAALRLACGVAL